jgi:putative endonuclease
MQPWRWYVYIIECEDGTYYTGMTWNMPNRWEQHLSLMGSKYTAKHKPKKVVYVEEHEELDTARYREKQIKDWSQAKKRKLISGEWGKEWTK